MTVTRYEDEMGIWEKTDLGNGRTRSILVEPAAKPAPEPKAKKPKKSKK